MLLTPVGLASLAAIFWRRKQALSGMTGTTADGLRLLAWLTLLPLGVFFVHSLFRMSKLNWTAPIWLGALPYLALFTRPLGRDGVGGGERRGYFPRLWPATTAALLVLYGALLHYLAVGFPGIPYPQNDLEIGKRSLARQVHGAREVLAAQTGKEPLVVCWDSEKMASWVAYYLAREDLAAGEGMARAVGNTTGAHFFGETTKMFRYWHPTDQFTEQPLLVIAKKTWQLEWQPILVNVTPISEMKTARTFQSGKPTGRYFYRDFVENSNQPEPTK